MRGRRGGWGWCWHGGWGWRAPVSAPKGYTYIGPCWCGFGPHAFYQDEKGRIVPAWQIYGVPPATGKWQDEKANSDDKKALDQAVKHLQLQEATQSLTNGKFRTQLSLTKWKA